VERVNALKPDLIALTGDFVSVRIYKDWDRKSARNATPCAALLSKLRARLGIFAVLGNHDFRTDPKIVAASIEGAGIPVLRNQAAEIHAAAGLWIAGVNDILNGADDLDQALANIPRGATTILLAHEPDFADDVAQQSAVQLQLSGHSHGGQIRIPVPGGVYAPYLPELGRKYPWGLRNVGGLTLYTNRGIGTLYVPSRVYCPPEITLLKLTRRAAD
jgi:predicted MPP superfamily phosphohydrolase